jgi:methylenetetrahydrofolate dehydrogenase (NADP+)/methenyltetrahydrofolate cyclohydrolase
MESNKKLVNVRIFGQEYPIRASSNEDYIKEVAAYVDKKMHEVQRSVPSSMNASKIAILAAMNISDELFGARRGEYSFKGEVESKVKSLIERIVMETSILSGLEASKALYSSLESRISHLKDHGIVPGLAAVLVGNNPASEIYVKNKTKKFESLGLKTDVFRLEETISEDKLLSLISKLNTDTEFHGILVQLPLPKHIDSEKVLNAIIPTKDVDGFHPENAGLLSIGKPRFVPCTPKGIMFILKHFNIDLNGKHVVVIGRSNIVGRPISILASLKELGNATVTLCHSGTKDLKYFSKQADVLVAALGSPEFVDSSYIKEGACLVDVGINRIEIDGKSKIVGDVNQDSVTGIASSLTPVPKGVGPMTIAMLVENTVLSAELLLN